MGQKKAINIDIVSDTIWYAQPRAHLAENAAKPVITCHVVTGVWKITCHVVTGVLEDPA